MSPAKAPPVIDFSDFLSGDDERVQRCASQIRDACLTQGFFQIVNHTIPLSLQRDILEMSKQFFDLPLDDKLKLDKSQNEYNRGYQKMASQMIEANTAPDLKEGYYLGRELPTDHPQVAAGKFAHGPNLWPERLGEPFRKTCMDYLNHIMELGEHIMQALAVSLGYKKEFFDSFSKDPMCFFKMLHYPPQPTDANALQKGLGAHRDFGALTLLLQGDVPGLEVWDDDVKEWAAVPPIEGAYVINLGNMFQQWTNDQYRSVVHRVVNYSGVERYSIPANFNGNPDFIVRCIEKCRSKGEDEKYAPVTVEDYIRPQYADTYGRAGIYNIVPKVGVVAGA